VGLVPVLRAALSHGADQTGITLGTVAYVSPEIVLQQGAPDARSDVFSLAAVVFEALTGAPPFGVAGLAAQLRSALPHARGIREAVPEALDAALVQALAPLRGDRPRSMRAFLEQFAQLSSG
jgi:serine/threonine protein kinase